MTQPQTPASPLVTRHDAGGEIVLRLHADRLDAASADTAKTAMKEAAGTGTVPVTVDLGEVAFIDSSGLGALVALRKSLDASRPVRLARPSPFAAKVLQLTRLDRVFEIRA